MIKTELTEMLGIKHPIIQAGMGPFKTDKLAVAVANAGALGILSSSGIMFKSGIVEGRPVLDLGPLAPEPGDSYEVLKEMIRRASEATEESKGYFGVNIMVSAELLDHAKKFIQAMVDAKRDPKIGERLCAIITSAGNPNPWAKMIKPSGLKWFHVVSSTYHAKKCEKAGVDGLIASGQEGGGHVAWEPVHSMVLTPAVVNAVKIPVVAAGGFCDGATLVAALALGAVGVQMGTRFIATKEGEFVQIWKDRILKSGERDSIVARGLVGPLRYLKNVASVELAKLTIRKTPNLYLSQADATLDPEIMKAEHDGMVALLGEDDEKPLFFGGEVAGRIKDIPSAKELIESTIKEAEDIIKRMPEKFRSE